MNIRQAGIFVGLDAASIEKLAAFAGIEATLNAAIDRGLKKAANEIKKQAISNMNWKDDEGILSGSMTVLRKSRQTYLVGSNLPYANRREFGFSGQTDRLGRYFPNDPGDFFLTTAADGNVVVEAVRDEVSVAFASLLEAI